MKRLTTSAALILLLAACASPSPSPSATPKAEPTATSKASLDPDATPTATPRPSSLPSPTIGEDGLSPYEPTVFLFDQPVTVANAFAMLGFEFEGMDDPGNASQLDFSGERDGDKVIIKGIDNSVTVIGPDGEPLEEGAPQLETAKVTVSGSKQALDDAISLLAPEAADWLKESLTAEAGSISLGYADLELASDGDDWALTVTAPEE